MIGQASVTLPPGIASCEEWAARLLNLRKSEVLPIIPPDSPCYPVLQSIAAGYPLPVAIPTAPGWWAVFWEDATGNLATATVQVVGGPAEAIRKAVTAAGEVAAGLGETGRWLPLLLGGGIVVVGLVALAMLVKR